MTGSPRSALLATDTAAEYLRTRGIILDDPVEVRMLGGGVSNIVLSIDTPTRRLVLKQSLPRLRVADDWRAPRERVLTEAAALAWASAATPGMTPEVVDVDSEHMTVTMTGAPSAWHDWKQSLLHGRVDTAVAGSLGRVLASWHRTTNGGEGLPRELAQDATAFEALRLAPYHATVAQRLPEHADAVLAVARRIRETRTCLVHGDFSPKNILVGDGRHWVIDFEVAHLGDPVFDVAFLLSHLALKAIHRPDRDSAYDAAARAFLRAYRGAAASLDTSYLWSQVGCLLLARAVGKSPAEYLTSHQRSLTIRVGARYLREPVADLSTAIAVRTGCLA